MWGGEELGSGGRDAVRYNGIKSQEEGVNKQTLGDSSGFIL